ncbi:MAG TPA: hypothetical protein VH044_13880 [Polyangiaceae bacterium]|nr:hypothetical protein [Polyangiaceae bacterium]
MRPALVAALAVSLAAAAGVAGCTPPQGAVAAQQVAQELNVDARFGRTEIAMDHVAPAAREAFAAHHRAWGGSIRVADVEMAGVHAHGEHDVDILVQVAWYRPAEQELRTTTLQQKWKDASGWQLVDEKRLDGDVGLLGEAVVFEAPEEQHAPAYFPTVRLGSP